MRYAPQRSGRFVAVGDEHGDGEVLCHVLYEVGFLTFDVRSGVRVAALTQAEVLHREGEEREAQSLRF